MPKNRYIDATVAAYAEAHSAAPDEIQHDLIEATAAFGRAAAMQIAPDQGAFMSILTAVLQPRFAVEIGTFTGYSSLAVARALPEGGRLLCCDVSTEWTDVARAHWDRAGVSDRIELVIAPAIQTLNDLRADQVIDLAFIDADKTSYIDYYEAIVPRLSSSGVILIDNTLWSGRVAQAPSDDDGDDTVALRALNDHVHADTRTEAVQLTIGDGVTMVRRR